ncbi:MAG: Ribosomal small subunit pseudouridine synthase A [Firmicutes bacterium ADurb.Bin300]|nr:MAG: Ribosomal small subunit pseudouridine synthase A [Firmicutes bacterium ADurb.Bin300]
MKAERIDKILSICMGLARSEVKKLIREGCVTFEGKTISDGSFKIPYGCPDIEVSGSPLDLKEHVYIMLNKPPGVICASDGKGEKTVIDILPEGYKRRSLFPAGRLDKDTEGFCLITDDGIFAHKILSPKSHVPKTYLAHLEKPIDIEEAAALFAKGLYLGGEQLLPAALRLVSGGDKPLCEIVLNEGKYHQVKLMFSQLGNTVLELKRTHIGRLKLDETLASGECRYLTDEELLLITKR